MAHRKRITHAKLVHQGVTHKTPEKAPHIPLCQSVGVINKRRKLRAQYTALCVADVAKDMKFA
jgi:hypothetical protein